MASLLPEGKQQFFDLAGNPLVGGKLYTYDAGTLTPRPTWMDSGEVAENSNPIILDSRGEATIFWRGGYKVRLCDANDVEIWTVDNIQELQPDFRTSEVGSLRTPAGTTVQRDNPADPGYFRYNVTLQRFEGYHSDAKWKQFITMMDAVYRTGLFSVTTGSGSAFAVTLYNTPQYTADENATEYRVGMSIPVKFHTAAGVSPTFTINGIASPPTLVKQNLDGTLSPIASGDFPAGHVSNVTILSATEALVEKLPQASISDLPQDFFSFYNFT